jgi:hypothetical protein
MQMASNSPHENTGANAAAIAVSIQLATAFTSTQPPTAPAESSTTTALLPSSPAADCAHGVIAALTSNVPRSILLAIFVLMLSLFIASVSSSYTQTKSAAETATAFDDFTSPMYFTGVEDPRWTMYSVNYKQFGIVNTFGSSVNTSLYVAPIIADGYDPHLYNLCRGEPYWKCDFTKYAGGGLPAHTYSLSGGNVSIWNEVPSRNYVRLELTWSTLTPALTGGSVTLNYHIVLPEYMLDSSQFPATSMFQVKFMLTPKIAIVLNQGGSAFDGTVTLQLPSGSWNLYPFDQYERLLVPACQVADPGARFGAWSIANPASRNIAALTSIAISFILKIDKSDLGVFSHSEAFEPAGEAQPDFEENKLAQVRPIVACSSFRFL